MANKTFLEKFYGSIMPKIYGLGAAVVIVGAMFKLEGWAGASVMLIAGLGVEALIFAFSAFEPASTDYTKKMYEANAIGAAPKQDNSKDEVSLGKILKEAAVSKESLKQFGEGMTALAANAKGMSDMSNAVSATNAYADSAKKASEGLSKISQSTTVTATAMAQMADSAKSSGEIQTQLKTSVGSYQIQLQNAATQLDALNKVYKEELNDSQSHVKAIKSFYANIDTALAGVSAATKEAEEFKAQMGKLNTNVNSLNKVYGAMLSAMKTSN
ncbi:MAG: gliding motility-associated protein GldL [Roseivirga sp.]|jgi:gliding motility-associated protein GldL